MGRVTTSMSCKKVIPPKSEETLAATSAGEDARPRRQARERLKTSVLEELWSIWRANPRVPSIKSRRLWAISRDASPYLVDSWFLRRRTCAKKAGQPLPEGSYDLPLDPPIAPKREPSATSIEPELEATPDLPSDDTVVYPPDSNDLNDLEASSDTVFDEDTVIELKRIETPAYKALRPENHHFQLKPSSADPDAPDNCCDEDISSFENPFFPVCNQGRRKESDFTCILCSKSDQDEVLRDSGATSDSTGDSYIPYPRLDFFPGALSELSAIPFLFRTPSAVPRNDAINYQSVDDWTVVEDELARLVNDGELDFSFLDDPRLASMELVG